MSVTEVPSPLSRLEELRAELADLAFTLEQRGEIAAADIAISTSVRLAELRDEIEAGRQTCPARVAGW